MYGGYVKDSLLQVNDSGLRTFTQVMDDGSTSGSYSYRDRKDPTKKAYRTPWMPVAHKIYTEKCNTHKDKTGADECPPMIIRVRETTLGNNKYNFGKRQRQYYVIQEFYDEPRRIGKIVYTYEPRSWFMKWDETPEAFFVRLYSKRDAKRLHLPPIPDAYLNKIEAKIKVIGPSPRPAGKRGRSAVTIAADVPITLPPPKKGRVKRTTRKEMDEALRTPTIIFTLDGEPHDTRIEVNKNPVDIMDEFLRQDEPGDAELLAAILDIAYDLNGWDYSGFIEEHPDKLVIDPEGTHLNGETMVTILNNQKDADMTIPDYLSAFVVESYRGPTGKAAAATGSKGSFGSEGTEGTEGAGDTSEEEQEDLAKYAGEAGQKYLEENLEGILSRLGSRK